ncbi:hypothetical protein SAMN05444274_106270 [Mariniphaga anaerophila]|uniref:Uncharacterized protein n=1 Tax=Mariniphaga anaerophila TaxID=1484053 RepID=A0A1M5CUD8_9BACT|nr:hypothetical protein [Mariniphaga anaerophila]SHF58345.1 hypothetical protein SAMN05444274_106270 [Mariniphaga anaerophila]
MFTIGIFTTHIPYIAFVCFYAFFFLFDYQKNFDEEAAIGEKNIRHEVALSANTQHGSDCENFDFNKQHSSISPKLEQIFYMDRKTKILIPVNEPLFSINIAFSYFSRPPPAA